MIGSDFLHMQRVMSLARTDHGDTFEGGVLCQQQRIAQVARTVSGRRIGRLHGASQHHRFGPRPHHFQQKRGFFQRVGAVSDDHGLHIRAFMRMQNGLQKETPNRWSHVFAVNLGHILHLQAFGMQSCLMQYVSQP